MKHIQSCFQRNGYLIGSLEIIQFLADFLDLRTEFAAGKSNLGPEHRWLPVVLELGNEFRESGTNLLKDTKEWSDTSYGHLIFWPSFQKDRILLVQLESQSLQPVQRLP
ncbi:MAG: hypothetical protein GY953_09480 [bacterium]|nr:hypothetical protein [bacterium]